MLTYPISRAQYLVGKVLFNIVIAVVQAGITIGLADALLGVRVRWMTLPLVVLSIVPETWAGATPSQNFEGKSGAG